MKAKLVHKTDNYRVYELSEPIFKGESDIMGEINIKEEFEATKNRIRKDLPKDRYDAIIVALSMPCTHICISDATTHIERLVFPAYEFNGEYSGTSMDIGGKHTMMIHGGDRDAVYDDEVYIRRLAQINGLSYEKN